MEFGRVPAGVKQEAVNVILPLEPSFNKNVLSGKRHEKIKAHVGCPKWGKKEWVGTLFPERTKEKDFLDHYVTQYNCIELNATHYNLYDEANIKKWVGKAQGHEFVFCPKFYKGITHFGTLRGKDYVTKQFLEEIAHFGNHLGPAFIQVSESFAPKRKDELFEYIRTLPKERFTYFLEVRFPEWFSDSMIWAELVDVLRTEKLGLVVTDTLGRREVVHTYLTIPQAMIRFVAHNADSTDLKRIDMWADKLQYWRDHGLEAFYFFIHTPNDALSPQFTTAVITRFNRRLGTTIKTPTLYSK